MGTPDMHQSHVLVVDPNPLILQRVKSALAGSDFGILSARDAIEAESCASGQQIAVVLSSTGLPRGNGYDLARSLLSIHPDAKIFLLSGGFEVYNRDRAEQAGVVGRISKPFSSDGLRTRLEKVLGPLSGSAKSEPPAEEPSAQSEAPPTSIDDLSSFDIEEPLPEMLPVSLEPLPEEPVNTYSPPTSAERIATIIPRDFRDLPAPGASIEALKPALERAVMEVLPEVVEVVLRRSLQTSPAFRDLVEVAVDEAVRAHLPAIARQMVQDRLAEIEAQDPDGSY
jgi:CheY-like chemotaxis protein